MMRRFTTKLAMTVLMWHVGAFTLCIVASWCNYLATP